MAKSKPKHQFSSRTKARKRAIDVVFEADQRGMGGDGRVLDDLLRERRVVTAAQTPLPEYSIEIVDGVARDLNMIDGLIASNAKVPGLDRIPAVDLAAMRVAIWEMLHRQADVPPVVAIDEAIAIVKSISTDDSPAFVNAVLDAVRRQIDSEGLASDDAPSAAFAAAVEPDDAAEVEADEADAVDDTDGEANLDADSPEDESTDETSEDDLDELLDEY